MTKHIEELLKNHERLLLQLKNAIDWSKAADNPEIQFMQYELDGLILEAKLVNTLFDICQKKCDNLDKMLALLPRANVN
jgi:hypothetical protein